jgi:hypothetical protein
LLTCHNFLPSPCKNKINQPNFIGLHISYNNNRFIEEFPVINFILSCKTILLNNILYKKFILYFSDIEPNIDTGPVNAMVMVGRACVVCIALCYVQTLNKTKMDEHTRRWPNGNLIYNEGVLGVLQLRIIIRIKVFKPVVPNRDFYWNFTLRIHLKLVNILKKYILKLGRMRKNFHFTNSIQFKVLFRVCI